MGAEAEPGATAPDPGRATLLIAGARLADGRTVDVLLGGERIEAVGTAGSLRAAERIDLSGYLLLPAPAEPHAHLDEALTAGTGPLAGGGGVSAEDHGGEDLRRRITEAALTHLGYGSTAVRTHVEVSPATGLDRLDAALQAARDLRGLMELQIVATPGRLSGGSAEGSTRGSAGAFEQEGRALLRAAARAGAHALGGSLGGSLGCAPGGSLGALVDLARSCDLPLDLHASASALADATDHVSLLPLLPPGSVLTVAGPLPTSALGALTALTTLGGPGGPGSPARTGGPAGPGIVVLPQGGCCAGPSGPDGFDPATARRLADCGLPFAAGSGALRDTTRPTGRADPIEAAFLLSATAGLSAAAAYDAVASGARTLLGLSPTAVEAGRPAELLALRGESLAAALSGGHSRVVLHAGRVVSRTSAVREYADTTTAAVPRQGRPLGPA